MTTIRNPAITPAIEAAYARSLFINTVELDNGMMADVVGARDQDCTIVLALKSGPGALNVGDRVALKSPHSFMYTKGRSDDEYVVKQCWYQAGTPYVRVALQ